MTLNLEKLRVEILADVQSRGLVPYPVCQRTSEPQDAVYWDVAEHPAHREFLDAAVAAGVKLVHIFERIFEAEQVAESIRDMEDLPIDRQEQRKIEKHLDDLRIYDGMIGALELSFHYAQRDHIFELKTSWFDEYRDLLETIDEAYMPVDEMDEEDEGPLGSGYFSKN